jgi:TetR/AcrR family transcriptional regulator, lmrAB and yxaGH operons repressor
MVQAARQLIRERGYHATAFSDVLERAGAPRGSVYFHFPGGKAELARAAAAAHAAEQVAIIDRAAAEAGAAVVAGGATRGGETGETGAAVEPDAAGESGAVRLVGRYVDLAREGMVASGYSRGCGVAPLVTEDAARDSAGLGETSRQAFTEMTDRMAFHLAALGLGQAGARMLAEAAIAGVEGALVTSRGLRSPAPYEAVRAALASYAQSLGTPRPSAGGRASSD